jgi:putative NADH-flavin reductase
VVGVARKLVEGSGVPEAVTLIEGSIYDPDVVEKAADGVDAIVSAVHFSAGDGRTLLEALPSLLDAATREGARLGFVGGSSSLSKVPGGPLGLETISEEWRAEATAGVAMLDALRASDTDVDWFYVSPSSNYGSWVPGERTGTFRLGGDVLLVAEDGSSTISGADFAIAFVDELEKPAHHQARFTVGY